MHSSPDIDPKELAAWPAEKALPWLFEHYAPLLYQLGLKFCGDEDEAEDLVQEVLLNAYRAWDQFDGRAKPTTWFYTIAARACQRRHRLRSGEPATLDSLDELLPSRNGYVVDLRPGQDESTPFEEQVARETREAVERAISALPLEFRMPLVLSELVELSHKEISEITGIPKATVKTRVHRGRLKLRKELDEQFSARPAPQANTGSQVCYDLLKAKLEAMDHDLESASAQLDTQLCGRCGAVFAGLDAAQHACRALAREPMPEEARRRLHRNVEQAVREVRAAAADV